MTVYVGNLSFDASEEDLNEVFKEYGSVKRVQLPADRETGRMRGFAFVEMSEEAEEEAAIEELDGAEWMGRTLKVNKARPRSVTRVTNSRLVGGGTAMPSESSESTSFRGSVGYQNNPYSGSRDWSSSGPEVGKNAPQEKSLEGRLETASGELKVVLGGNLDDISESDLMILENLLQKISSDSTIKITQVEEGSIILRLSGSEEGFKIIKHLWETGQVSSLIGLPVEAIDYETETSDEDSKSADISEINHEKAESGLNLKSESSTNYIFDRCTVLQNNQASTSKSVTRTENQSNYMPENYNNNLQGANIANMANAVKDNARQQAKQNIFPPDQNKTLSESAHEIQQLLQQLERNNPTATETEKISYVDDETTSSFKRRVVGALQAGGEAAIEEFLDNPYVSVGKAVVKGWMKPE
jgi:RNA recognition motif-containing protein